MSVTHVPPFPDSMMILCLTAFIRKSIISWSGSTPPVNNIPRNTNSLLYVMYMLSQKHFQYCYSIKKKN